MKHKFVAFDLETTGLDPQRDQILQIGAVAYGGDGDPIEFEALVRHERYEGDAFALQMNAAILRRLAGGSGVRAIDAACHFVSFVREHCAPRPHPVGFNVGSFDVAFLTRMFREFKNFGSVFGQVGDLLHHRALELGSFLSESGGVPVSSSEALREEWGDGAVVTHDALQDARDAAYLHASNCFYRDHHPYPAWIKPVCNYYADRAKWLEETAERTGAGS
jgi:oligoribonuclease (3'-5' exoribonuclease)